MENICPMCKEEKGGEPLVPHKKFSTPILGKLEWVEINVQHPICWDCTDEILARRVK